MSLATSISWLHEATSSELVTPTPSGALKEIRYSWHANLTLCIHILSYIPEDCFIFNYRYIYPLLLRHIYDSHQGIYVIHGACISAGRTWIPNWYSVSKQIGFLIQFRLLHQVLPVSHGYMHMLHIQAFIPDIAIYA